MGTVLAVHSYNMEAKDDDDLRNKIHASLVKQHGPNVRYVIDIDGEDVTVSVDVTSIGVGPITTC